jgi:hypothetical protein
MRKTLMKGGGAVAAVLVAMMVAGLIPPGSVNATHEPADKTSAAGSAAVVIGANNVVTLLNETVKTALPTDLILGVTLECVITTEITTIGNDTENAEGRVRIWVEIDGAIVPVSQDDTTDPGKVTFCNRFEERQTSAFEDQDATIRTLNRTGTANAFNWLALNVGSATHEITVKAEFTTTATQGASALAAVGKRTLVIEPTKAANDEAVTALG